MKRRTVIELLFGVTAALLFFYWIYLRPQARPGVYAADSAQVADRAGKLRPKTLVIGIDGLSWEPLLELINQGKLPHFTALLERGRHGTLKPEDPLISSSAWTTLATGVPAARHRIDDLSGKIPFQYRERRLGSADRRAPAVWQTAARFGRKVALLNWPAADREDLPGGIFVAENTDPAAPAAGSVMPEAWRELVAAAPRPSYPALELELLRMRDPLLARAYQIDLGLSAAAEFILRREPPDLMMVQFGSLAAVSTGFWKHRWPTSLDYTFDVPAEERSRYADAIENHYLLLDRILGGLSAAAPGYNLIVVSPYGQVPSFPPGNIRLELNRLLDRLDWLRFDEAGCDRIITALAGRGELTLPWPATGKALELCQELSEESATWLARGEELMPAPAVEAFITVRYPLREARGDAELEMRIKTMTELARSLLPGRQRPEIVWANTRAWNPRDFRRPARGIYLNLAGREPEGVVPRGEFKSARRELGRALSTLRTESGVPLFSSVEVNREKDVFPVESIDAPDLLVEVNRAALVEEYVFRGPDDQDPIPLAALRMSYADVSAENGGEGVIIVAGGNGFLRQDAAALDFAPSLLNLLGLPVPAAMPGKVNLTLFPGPEEILYIE